MMQNMLNQTLVRPIQYRGPLVLSMIIDTGINTDVSDPENIVLSYSAYWMFNQDVVISHEPFT